MNTLTGFRVGHHYTNDQIRFSLGLESFGGIRPSISSKGKLRHLVILTAAEETGKLLSEKPYHDRIEGDIIFYTTQGREGDQELKWRNKIATQCIEAFIAQFVDSLSNYSSKLILYMTLLLLTNYNAIVEKLENDKSLLIEIPNNLAQSSD